MAQILCAHPPSPSAPVPTSAAPASPTPPLPHRPRLPLRIATHSPASPAAPSLALQTLTAVGLSAPPILPAVAAPFLSRSRAPAAAPFLTQARAPAGRRRRYSPLSRTRSGRCRRSSPLSRTRAGRCRRRSLSLTHARPPPPPPLLSSLTHARRPAGRRCRSLPLSLARWPPLPLLSRARAPAAAAAAATLLSHASAPAAAPFLTQARAPAGHRRRYSPLSRTRSGRCQRRSSPRRLPLPFLLAHWTRRLASHRPRQPRPLELRRRNILRAPDLGLRLRRPLIRVPTVDTIH